MKEYSFGIVLFAQIDKTTRILFVQHIAGHWGFPKGHAEPHESPQQSARRELAEETGITDIALLEHEPLLEYYDYTLDDEQREKKVTYFIGITTHTDVTHQEKELIDAQWLTLEDALKKLTHPETKQTLQRAMDIFMKQ